MAVVVVRQTLTQIWLPLVDQVAAKVLMLTALIILAVLERQDKEKTAVHRTGQLTMLVAVAAGRAL
jgi:hypothetical protein